MKPSSPRKLQCYHCRHRFEVSWQTMSCSCPKCSKPVNVEDLVIKVAYSVRKIQTCGKLIVQKKGRVIAQTIEAHGGVEVEGILEGNVLSGGPVRILAKGQWKGDCAAPSLEVQLGGQISRGFFTIPDHSLALLDLLEHNAQAAGANGKKR
ncbi:MAG: polymer-forming cytoskeletal protein [Phycisphaerales bacterium]